MSVARPPGAARPPSPSSASALGFPALRTAAASSSSEPSLPALLTSASAMPNVGVSAASARPSASTSSSSALPASPPASASAALAAFAVSRDGQALAAHVSTNYHAYARARRRFLACFALVCGVCACACAFSVGYRVRVGEVEHWSLSLFGASLLWLLSSIASGLFAQRLRAPAVYARDLNRWLRLYGVEWRWKEDALRCLTAQQMARRRARREQEQLREAERARMQAQRRAEEAAERERLSFLEQLEREDDSERIDAPRTAQQQPTDDDDDAPPPPPTLHPSAMPSSDAIADAPRAGRGSDALTLISASDFPSADLRRRTTVTVTAPQHSS